MTPEDSAVLGRMLQPNGGFSMTSNATVHGGCSRSGCFYSIVKVPPSGFAPDGCFTTARTHRDPLLRDRPLYREYGDRQTTAIPLLT